MKTQILTILAALILFGCSKTGHSPVPTVKAARFAPEGVFYTLNRISITNDDGIIGIAPGTEVSVIGRNGPQMHVTDGTHKFDVSESNLTNNLDVADKIRGGDATSQASIKAQLAKGARLAQEKEITEAKAQQAHQNQIQAQAGPSQPMGSSLDKGTYNDHHNRYFYDSYGRVINSEVIIYPNR